MSNSNLTVFALILILVLVPTGVATVHADPTAGSTNNKNKAAALKEEVSTLNSDPHYGKDTKVASFTSGTVCLRSDGVVSYSGLLYEPHDIASMSYQVAVDRDCTIYRTNGKPSGSYKIQEAQVSKYDNEGSIAYKYPDGTVVVQKHPIANPQKPDGSGIIIVMPDGRLIETCFKGNPSLVKFVASKRSALPTQ